MSIKLDRRKLQEGIIDWKYDRANFVNLTGIGRVKKVRESWLITIDEHADIAFYTYYTGCTGVTTGGAYHRIRDRVPWWLDDVNTCYWSEVAVGRATADVGLWKTVAGTATQLATEAVDLSGETRVNMVLSATGTTIKIARLTTYPPMHNPYAPVPAEDIKITVTDTAIASGAVGLADMESRYTPPTYWGAIGYWKANWVSWYSGMVRAPASTPPKPVAYFEVPVVGSGKLPLTPEGDIRPVSIWDDEEIQAQVDPFRVELPQEIVEKPLPVSKFIQKKAEVLKAKGWTTEEIKAFMPEAFPTERINRLACTHSALIPTDKSGKPIHGTAIVNVYQSSSPELRSIDQRIKAISEIRGVKRLEREEAISLALKMDDKLHTHDLVPCTKHDLGGKCFTEYRGWRIATVGDKPEFADTDIRKTYVKEVKGW